ncbi:MAG: WD40 repeat protein [Rhodobacteraceae bacterium HLUCCA08]|nr:MAG: WD40 repeat protein [Rhodobacteraceae bacterium HLUCCA08]
MIETKPPQALSLFDLIGREWMLEDSVTRVAFNANASAVACFLQNGTLALLPVADAEHPEKRIRMDFETGRTTIRPRENPFPPEIRTDLRGIGGAGCRLGDQGFAVTGEGASLWQVTARGQTVRIAGEGPDPVTALCSVDRAHLCVARGERLGLLDVENRAEQAACHLSAPVEHLAVSPDGAMLAARTAARVTILDARTLDIRSEIPADGLVTTLAWSPDGRWIAAGCEDKALLLVDVTRNQADRIVDFPGPVASVGFNAKAGALVASGAFRVVGWRLPELPFGTHEGAPILTGRPGLTLVDRVASNPERDTCAVGYANGLVTMCPLGQRDELMLCEGRGAPVAAMDWSRDGMHLALGFTDGRAAIVSFPKAMFK